MKKNKMMRLAAILLVGVLFTTSVIGGTFAKYTTADDGADYARVAKFGVVVEAKDFDMFAETYEQKADASKLAVEATVDVFAPGTSGSFADIKIKGTPEVAVDVEIVATVAVTGNWIVDGDFYCPIVVTVGTEKISGLDFTSATDFAAAIKAKIDGKSAKYDPNEELDAIYDTTNLDLAWEWAFEDATGTENNQTDVLDTKLGDRAVAEDLTISIGVEITVTQID